MKINTMKEQAAQAWLILFLNGFVLFIFLCLILRDVALILDKRCLCVSGILFICPLNE